MLNGSYFSFRASMWILVRKWLIIWWTHTCAHSQCLSITLNMLTNAETQFHTPLYHTSLFDPSKSNSVLGVYVTNTWQSKMVSLSWGGGLAKLWTIHQVISPKFLPFLPTIVKLCLLSYFTIFWYKKHGGTVKVNFGKF